MKQATINLSKPINLSDRQIRRLTSKSQLGRSFLKRFARFERTIHSNDLSSVDVFDFFIKNQKTILKQLNAIAKRKSMSAAAMLSDASYSDFITRIHNDSFYPETIADVLESKRPNYEDFYTEINFLIYLFFRQTIKGLLK